MLFVCLSHFVSTAVAPWDNASLSPAQRWFGRMAATVSMIATPTFVSVSGAVVGYLYRTNPAILPVLRRKLIDRGVFLLLIGHLLLGVPAYLQFHRGWQAFQFAEITDVIGVAIIVGPSILIFTSPSARVALGMTLLVISWAATSLWTPNATLGIVTAGYAFGTPREGMLWGFPFIPWLGIYILATVLGERLGACGLASARRRTELLLLHVGATATAIGLSMTVVRHGLRAFAPGFAVAHRATLDFMAAGQKFPPGPGYLLVFGGAGMILLATAFALARAKMWTPVTRPLSAMGRASFFVFILQQYVYYVAVPAIRLSIPMLLPVYYAATIVCFVVAAVLWNSFDANRYLTVGLWRGMPIVNALRSRVRTAPFAR